MEFDAFVGGETRTILMMNETPKAVGRLGLLSQLAHWLCTCKNWPLVRGLYEAIVESTELGEADWNTNFYHYESRIWASTNYTDSKETSTGTIQKDKKKAEKEKDKKHTEVYWCKEYQHNSCSEKSPHMASIKIDEPLVPVMHICATCWQWDKKRKEHPETDGSCPNKR